MELTDSDATRAAYPFAFRHAVTYRLDAGRLHFEQAVENRSAEPMPFSTGIHPYFQVPLTPRGERNRCFVRMPACHRLTPDARHGSFTSAAQPATELSVGTDVAHTLFLGEFSRPELALVDPLTGLHNRRFLESHLAQALAHHRLCVRANVLLGDLEVAQQRPEAAIEAWKRIESQSPAHLALVAERLIKAYRQMDKAGEGLNLLRGLLARYPSIDVLNVVFSCVLESEGTEPAYQLVRDEMRRSPSLLGLDKLLEAQLLEAPVQRRGDLELVKTLVHQHTRTLAMYKCDNCGFRAHQFYWHCPACGEWETYSPRRTEEKGLPA